MRSETKFIPDPKFLLNVGLGDVRQSLFWLPRPGHFRLTVSDNDHLGSGRVTLALLGTGTMGNDESCINVRRPSEDSRTIN